ESITIEKQTAEDTLKEVIGKRHLAHSGKRHEQPFEPIRIPEKNDETHVSKRGSHPMQLVKTYGNGFIHPEIEVIEISGEHLVSLQDSPTYPKRITDNHHDEVKAIGFLPRENSSFVKEYAKQHKDDDV